MDPTAQMKTKEADILRTESAMFVLTTVFVLARVVIHVSRRKTVELQDFFIYFAYALYVGLWTTTIIALQYLFKISAVETGSLAPYAGILDDAGLASRLIWSVQELFQVCLWSIKMSLLAFYRKLLPGLGLGYNRIWWGIVIFTSLAYIVCLILNSFTCKDMKALFAHGGCNSSYDMDHQLIGLYFGYAVDVSTDLLVMLLPVHLVYRLQISFREKAGVLVLFCSGFVCIAFATLRAVQLGVQYRQDVAKSDPKWLTMWTVIETSIATFIGCAPAFSSIVRTRINTKKSSYKARGYHKQGGDEVVALKTIGSSSRQKVRGDLSNIDTIYEEDRPSSQIGLRNNPPYIMTEVGRSDKEKTGESAV